MEAFATDIPHLVTIVKGLLGIMKEYPMNIYIGLGVAVSAFSIVKAAKRAAR